MMRVAGPPPGWINAAWWEVLGAPLRAERLDRETWINQLALAWCLVRRAEALTAAQLGVQADMVDRLLGRKFLPTYPDERFISTNDGTQVEYPTDPKPPFGWLWLP